MGLIFANFANFGQIREIKSSRKVWRSPIVKQLIRENNSSRNAKFSSSRKLVLSKINPIKVLISRHYIPPHHSSNENEKYDSNLIFRRLNILDEIVRDNCEFFLCSLGMLHMVVFYSVIFTVFLLFVAPLTNKYVSFVSPVLLMMNLHLRHLRSV